MTDTVRWLRYIFRLPFLDAAEVYDTFVNDLVPIRPSDPKLAEFTLYLLTNYIRDDAKFPPTI